MKRVSKYSKEALEDAVKNSDTISGVVRYFGIDPSTHKRMWCFLRDKIIKYDIEMPNYPHSRRGTVKYTKEVLQEAVSKSTSIYGVMRILMGEAKPSGGLHSHLKRQIEKFGIDTSHFTGRAWNKGKSSPRLNWEDVLVFHRRDHKEESTKLRKALLKSGRPYVCEKCGIDGEWNDESLTLEVHHKDGDNRNNLPENIGFLCPNCHSQIK